MLLSEQSQFNALKLDIKDNIKLELLSVRPVCKLYHPKMGETKQQLNSFKCTSSHTTRHVETYIPQTTDYPDYLHLVYLQTTHVENYTKASQICYSCQLALQKIARTYQYPIVYVFWGNNIRISDWCGLPVCIWITYYFFKGGSNTGNN